MSKINGPLFDRPNGSGDGRTALYDAVQGDTYCGLSNLSFCEPVKGYIDFARSSSVSSLADPVGSQPICTGATASTCTNVSYIPFASDGEGYAYVSNNPADLTALQTLPSSVFKALYTASTGSGGSGILTPGQGGWTGAKTLKACAIQSGSGTWGFFLTQIGSGLSAAQGDTNLTGSGTSNCNGLEENNLGNFLADANTLDKTSDWVIPMSTGNVIAQHNGVALNRSSSFFAATNTGIAPVADDFSQSPGVPATLKNALSVGATSLVEQLQVTFNSSSAVTIVINPGGADQESVTVNGAVTGSALGRVDRTDHRHHQSPRRWRARVGHVRRAVLRERHDLEPQHHLLRRPAGTVAVRGRAEPR